MNTASHDLQTTPRGTSSPANAGVVVAVRGSVVDIRFNGHLPPIYTVLRAGA